MINRLPSCLFAVAGLVAVTSQVLAQPTKAIKLPFVGCASDGQAGPAAAPIANSETPKLPPPAAGQLAYYASAALGVIVPRGWHCFGLYGSGGSILLVTPERHDATDLFRSDSKLTGPAIQLSRSLGSTSGRFEVARMAARLFPIASSFVRSVMDEDIEPAANFHFRPYPTDSLTRLSPTAVEFVTPGGVDGHGTDSRLAKNEQPISGVAILLPAEMDLVKLDIRLPSELRYLARHITKHTLASTGSLRRSSSETR